MKLLKKMLLIKWYYIEHQIINFDSLNFMTGKNASGKSTIIDALQILMLGDTRGHFFNKAANDRSGRTLDGYLRGEITNEGDTTTVKTKRSGRFTSYIAAEFFDTVERKSFTCGIVFDSYQDSPTEHMFFILNDKIPENHFIDEETKTPMDYKKLKTYFAKNYTSSKYSTFKESNKSYQNEFLAKMGALKPKFFNLFKKSVTFTPIDDIEKFISEYVCDVTNEIDIEKMKENIRHYKQLEKEAISMKERQKYLENIENLFNSYQNDVQKQYMQRYMLEKSDLQINIKTLDKLNNDYQKNIERIATLKDEKQNIENQIEQLTRLQDSKKEEKITSDIHKKQERLNEALSRINEELQEINSKTQYLIRSFRNKISKWRVNIKQFIEQKNIDEENTKILEVAMQLRDNIEYLLSINENNIDNLQEESLTEIKEQMEKVNSFANKVFFIKEQQEKEILEKQNRLKVEIENLESGIKPYRSNLVEFKNKLQTELELKFKEKVDVQILADLLEIKDMKWKNAIECYMNNQMFYIILNPKYYNEASRIYQNMAKDNKYYGFGIVDIENIQKINPQIEQNSLAKEIETENQNAKTYINYLLGRVIKCENVEDLRKYKTAITPDCMLYKNFVLRKIVDKNNEFKFIGKKSISEQIKIKKEESVKNEEIISKIQEIKSITKELKNADMFNNEEIKYIIGNISIIRKKPQLLEQKGIYTKELDSLDLTWLDKINKEIRELEVQIINLRSDGQAKDIEEGSLSATNRILENEKIPECKNNINKKQEEIKVLFNDEWIEKFGNPEFERLAEGKKLETIKKVAEEQIFKIGKQKDAKFNNVINARSEYVKQYQFSYDISNKEDNKEFSEELQNLRDIELPQYIDKIRDSKDKAYQQFREDFISKLKANIDEVESQVEELNDALKNSRFGVDEYQFKVKPKQEYKRFYDMITDPMLMEGQNLWSEAFNSKYHDEIDELFKKLTSSDIYDETYNKNISIYTDYKTYLSFDLVVTDKEGIVQHLSRTLDKKSGGETQTPFYISVLASFAQLYRTNKNRNDNTLRLIVFDEAFSKMDEERMKESLSLLPKFGFQAIIAAPSEKAGEIIPLVPNTLCVIRKNRDTVVREWGKDKHGL